MHFSAKFHKQIRKGEKYFKNPFINKETQKYIFENLNQIEITNTENDIPPGHPFAAIAIIYKK